MPRTRTLSQLPSTGTAQNVAKNVNMQRFLDLKGFRNRYFRFDDFTQDTIDLDYYAVAKTAGGDESDFAIDVTTGAGHGAISANTGATGDQACSLIGPLIYKGDKNVGMWIRFKIDDLTTVEWEVGFIAAVPASNASGVTDVDTPTVAMTNGAVVHMNTSQTLAIPAFVTEGSTANQGIKATALGVTPVDDTYMEALIQIQGDDVICEFRTEAAEAPHQGTALHNTRATGNSAGYIEGGTAIAPWAYVMAIDNAARVMTIDALAIWSDR